MLKSFGSIRYLPLPSDIYKAGLPSGELACFALEVAVIPFPTNVPAFDAVIFPRAAFVLEEAFCPALFEEEAETPELFFSEAEVAALQERASTVLTGTV